MTDPVLYVAGILERVGEHQLLPRDEIDSFSRRFASLFQLLANDDVSADEFAERFGAMSTEMNEAIEEYEVLGVLDGALYDAVDRLAEQNEAIAQRIRWLSGEAF